MNTKEYLRQIHRYDRIIQNKLSEVYQLRSMVSNISIAVEGDKVQTFGSKDILGDTVSKIFDLEHEIDDMVDIYIEKKQKIVGQIEGLLKKNPSDRGEEYYDVLTARFVRCLDFDDIYDEIGMSRSKMFYIYNEALNEFEKLYGKEYLY